MAKEKKCRSVSLVATDLGYPVYLKAGFVEQARYLFFSREKRDDVQGPKTANIRLAKRCDTQKILELDRDISGEKRQILISPFLKTAWVYDTDPGIQGYYLPGLKEGTILAKDEAAGLELMAFKYKGIHKAVLPEDNSAGIRYLKENGFEQYSAVKRMVWSEHFTWDSKGVFSRIAGNFG